MLLIIVVATISIAATTLVSMFLSKYTEVHVPSLGTIRAIGVEAYWDANLQNRTETLQWGTILPGTSQNHTLYLRSISNVKTFLKPLVAENWNPPSLSRYMLLSWDYNRTELQPSDVIKVTLTLSASSSSSFVVYLVTSGVTQFSFEIIIRTSE